jgi:hypothetical protein
VGILDDLNPLHWIDEVNKAIGSSTADILEFIGITDPLVDPDGIRAIAKTWKNLADAIGDANFAAGQATTGITLEGEAGQAFAERVGKVRSVASQVEGALHQGHDGLNRRADQAHDLIGQVGVIAAEIAEFEVAGLGLDLLMGPLGSVASTLAAGPRAARIVGIFAEVEAMVVRAGKLIEDLCAEIGGLARILKALQSVAKMAAAGAGSTLAWDAMFDPGRLTDPNAVLDDVEMGGALGVGFGAAGKAFAELMRGIGPLGPKFALAADGGGMLGALGDLKQAFGDQLGSRLDIMLAKIKDWDALPQDVKDKILGNFNRGNEFNARRKDAYDYSEVRVEPPQDSDQAWAQVDGYNPGDAIVSRKDSQLAALDAGTVKSYIRELADKYSPGTVITSRKGDGALHGTTLEGQMILEIPVQDAAVPQDLIKYAAERDIIIRDENGHVWEPEPDTAN